MLKDNEKNKITHTKEKIIKQIARESKKDIATVRTIYNALEQDIFEFLSCADQDNDVSVRLFEGISINSTFVPETERVNNLTGETITASSKIKPKANITRSYCDKLTNHNK